MLKHRIISGVTLGVALLLAVRFLPSMGAWITLVAIQSLAQLEFYDLLKKAGIPSFRLVGTVCGALLVSATFWRLGLHAGQFEAAYQWEHLILVVTVLYIFVRQFPQKNNPRPFETIACTLLGIFYVPYLFNYLTRLAFVWGDAGSTTVGQTGRLLVFYMILVVKCSDMGAYFTGRLLGKHKLFPRLSPGKTWEGLAGGVAWAIIASCLFTYFNGGALGKIEINLLHSVIIGVLLTLVGVAGDLFESLLKRAADMKDSGGIFPGMGGILDILDSLLFGAPVLYVYVRMILS